MKVLLICGHQAWAKGAYNPRLGLSEYDFNRPRVDLVAARLNEDGIDATADEYQRGGGNVARWNGASDLLVEFHLNGSNDPNVNGCCVLYGENHPEDKRPAMILANHLSLSIGSPLRHGGAVAVGPDVGDGRDARGLGGGYLIRPVPQCALVTEPFFISNDAAVRHALSIDIAGAYAEAIKAALQFVKP